MITESSRKRLPNTVPTVACPPLSAGTPSRFSTKGAGTLARCKVPEIFADGQQPSPFSQRSAIRWLTRALLVTCVCFAPRPLTASESPASHSQAELEFFETSVRPLLFESCVKCHGPDAQEADLRLDSREAIVKGGASGPAIVAGDPDQSRLIHAIRHEGDLEMPPDDQLDEQQIATLERWVKVGAPWPKDDIVPVDRRKEAQLKHWAFQPIADAAPPPVSNESSCRTPIDRFILARLEMQGLRLSPPADRRTLIRRVSYDLTGLPPTPAEVELFVNDSAPDAYARLVDRLLASPHYGEQWARHWLDVARYSDTKGYVYAREERFFVHAPAYRDWVVRAFNEDMPYDQFVRLQIAADQVAPDDRQALAAMGFLTLGRRFLGVTHDIIDDRIDVVTRGMLGLTVSCARCHDHKYDPIPTDDYYSLYGVLQNCVERAVPLAETSATGIARDKFESELNKRKKSLHDAMAAARKETSDRARQRVADYLLAQLELEKYPDESFSQIFTKDDIIPAFVRRWQTFLERASTTHDPVFDPWHRYASLRANEFSNRSKIVTQEIQSANDNEVNAIVKQAFTLPPDSMREVAIRYGELFANICRQCDQDPEQAEHTSLPDEAARALRDVLYGPNSPCTVPDENIVNNEFYFDTATTENLWKLQGEVDRWIIQSPESPPYAVALVDRNWIEEPRIFRRGNPASKGDRVPRQFLEVLSGAERAPFAIGSGRLELAREIASAQNPLTARVWVNRVWMHHFGAGLVQTPSDFGLRSAPPSHPELLDWLASQLIANRWSTKAIHRTILLSATYQQQSKGFVDTANVERAKTIDPENRLYWRMNARRLTFEEWRDTLLAVANELDCTLGGRAAALFPQGGDNLRRTLYGLVDRQFLTSALRMFDFANPDLHTPQRSETTVSQQALFALNHPFVANRARTLAARLEAPADNIEHRINQLYQLVFQREPTVDERQATREFLARSSEKTPPAAPESLAWQYGYGSLTESDGQVQFHALPHFSGAAWQGGSQWPDAALGWVQLTAEGGHAGNDLDHAAIRRWTAPSDGKFAVKSLAVHAVAAGDGIRCWIVSSRNGVLKSTVLHNQQQIMNVESIEVQAGDTIDFIVDLRANLNSDQFIWKAAISDTQPASGVPSVGVAPRTWDSAHDFAGTAPALLDPWEQLAQVLLMTNELMFVD